MYLYIQVCKAWFESQRTKYGKLVQSKSGQALKELTDRQHWIPSRFNFWKSHIKRKIISKSSRFRSGQGGPSAQNLHSFTRADTETDSKETRLCSKRHQPSIASTASRSVGSQPASVNKQMLDQFSQIKIMLTCF